MERRDFLRASATGVAAAAVDAGAASAVMPPVADPATTRPSPPTTQDNGMHYRILGATGERVSIVGMGGFHLAKPEPDGPTEADAIKIIRTGIDNGVNFCDNCWDYNKGESEIRLGKALRDGYREKAFVMTKLDGRTAQSCMGQLETSLKRLQTDHVDLIQFHEIIRMDDPDRVFAKGGALEAMLQAKQQGKVRHIGFTGHKSPAIHKKMFEVADAHQFNFDTVQMPVNIMDAHYDSFGATIFSIAEARNTAVLAMKTFGDTFIIDSHVADPIDMLHYSMSQPVAVVITGCDKMPILEQALKAARTWQPMPAAQQRALLAKSARLAANGKTEKYKTTTHFDGTTQNPQWLTQTS